MAVSLWLRVRNRHFSVPSKVVRAESALRAISSSGGPAAFQLEMQPRLLDAPRIMFTRKCHNKFLLICWASVISVGWLASWLPMGQGATEQTVRKTRNVILITTDGLRCQELFTGAEAELMSKEIGGVENTNALRKTFWRETPEARREALLPFSGALSPGKARCLATPTRAAS